MRRPRIIRGLVACLWTRRALLAVPALLILMAAGPSRAEGDYARPVRIAPLVGARVFAEPLRLNSEFAFGLRVSMGVSERVSVAMDVGHSSPVRKTSGKSMSFGEMRLLTTVDLLRGPVRPYALVGLGGQFFNFHDTSGAVGLVFAGGLGVEYDPPARWSVFAEGSADFYRADYYSSLSSYLDPGSANQTLATGVFTLGIQYEF
ncbi:MAG TPA: hypothetical protein VFU59_07135 [Candidatus Eisenbacteria bacterium]|nr:hypothetical protein [Candidatus Eisenbacteria bacterium]